MPDVGQVGEIYSQVCQRGAGISCRVNGVVSDLKIYPDMAPAVDVHCGPVAAR